MATTTELTVQYIKDHPDIKRCLKKDLINYSSLSRKIAKDLVIRKKSSTEAILIAARRFREKLKKDVINDYKIENLLQNSSLEMKNKIVVAVTSKKINIEKLITFQKSINGETWFLLEGSDNYTLITQESTYSKIKKYIVNNLIKLTQNQAIIRIISPKNIETVPGVIGYLTSLFHENNINITEFLSIWTDTLFVIDNKHSSKALQFLQK